MEEIYLGSNQTEKVERKLLMLYKLARKTSGNKDHLSSHHFDQ